MPTSASRVSAGCAPRPTVDASSWWWVVRRLTARRCTAHCGSSIPRGTSVHDDSRARRRARAPQRSPTTARSCSPRRGRTRTVRRMTATTRRSAGCGCCRPTAARLGCWRRRRAAWMRSLPPATPTSWSTRPPSFRAPPMRQRTRSATRRARRRASRRFCSIRFPSVTGTRTTVRASGISTPLPCRPGRSASPIRST